MNKRFLARVDRSEFLSRYWQKKPLFAPGALQNYVSAVTREELFALASRDDVESRVVLRSGGKWQVRHGPFKLSELYRMPRAGWTLLVQAVDHTHPQMARLLREFAFLPYARLDDVMVSYASAGGGVGPHVDSYDVFLVQGAGSRRWKLSSGGDRELLANAPLKLLKHFAPTRECVAKPGDVLYLPPQYAHDGVAVDECITYSVGFRAPSAQELALKFLDFAQERVQLEGIYSDPAPKPARHPACIPREIVEFVELTIDRLRWSRADVQEFAGRFLSEPKAHVVFQRPKPRLAGAHFRERVARSGVTLALPTRMLFRGKRIFINGEAVQVTEAGTKTLTRLADARELKPPVQVDAATARLLYDWYTAGYLEVTS